MYKKDYWMVLSLLEGIERTSEFGTVDKNSQLDSINADAKKALAILRGYDTTNV